MKYTEEGIQYVKENAASGVMKLRPRIRVLKARKGKAQLQLELLNTNGVMVQYYELFVVDEGGSLEIDKHFDIKITATVIER